MPGESGFDFLQSLEERNFSLIFVTAYEKYAVRAFKANAIDFVLKPIDIADLQQSVKKGLAPFHQKTTMSEEISKASFGNFLKDLGSEDYPEKITLPNKEDNVIRDVAGIKKVEANSNYSNFSFFDGSQIVVARTLKFYEEVLDPKLFVRCNRSIILNMNEIKDLDEESLTTKSNEEIVISRRRKKGIELAFQQFRRSLRK